ncbi:MAG: aminotransferase class V-fold PLP-dependent enzyme [Cyclobacteriaceae bacterium]
MNSRRSFLQKSSSAAFALLSGLPETGSAESLSALKAISENEQFWKAVRSQFSLKKDQVYFNNGTMGPVPDYTLNRMVDNMRYNAIHGAETDYKGEGPQLLTGYFPEIELRKKVAGLVNADYREIILTQNATYGMNYVANGLDLKEGDEILNTDQEHGGGFAAWQLLAKRRGCIYKQAKMPVPANDPDEIVDAVFREVTDKTKVIAIPHIVSVFGVVMPVERICAEAKRRGIFTVLDGAQTVGQIQVDVKKIGCDAYYSSLHKWLLAPGGSGLLYISEDRIANIWSTIASYNWDNQDDHGFRLMQSGTGNTAQYAGLDAAIDFYHTIGAERWTARIKELGDYLRERLIKLDKITIYSSTHPAMCAGMTTYALEGFTGPELQKKMWEEERLQPRSVGKEYLRQCVHIYNNEEEIDRAISVVSSQ